MLYMYHIYYIIWTRLTTLDISDIYLDSPLSVTFLLFGVYNYYFKIQQQTNRKEPHWLVSKVPPERGFLHQSTFRLIIWLNISMNSWSKATSHFGIFHIWVNIFTLIRSLYRLCVYRHPYIHTILFPRNSPYQSYP
jgi:hypothetical protein